MSWCAAGLARVRRTGRMFPAPLFLQCRRLAAGGWTSDDLLELCRRRCFLLGEEMTPASVLGGRHSLGPLGAQMKRNLVKEWWDAMELHPEQVLPIDSLCRLPGTSDPSAGPPLKTLPKAGLDRLQNQSPAQEELEKMADLRQDLLYGALYYYPSCLELLNRKLPFGIAEVGRCFHPISDDEDPDTCRAGEGTAASLVWFSSAKTCAQWRDYWLRQRLLWWRKGRDGRKSAIPHVVWMSSDVEGGLLAFLCDALQVTESAAPRGKEQRRTVLKIHPSLAPLTLAVDLGKGPAADLRLVCQGLCAELRGRGISVWPGYLETLHTPMEQLFTRYDEMGVVFTALVSDVTLESGLLHLRSRDTTIKETVHVSKLGAFLTQHMTAAAKR